MPNSTVTYYDTDLLKINDDVNCMSCKATLGLHDEANYNVTGNGKRECLKITSTLPYFNVGHEYQQRNSCKMEDVQSTIIIGALMVQGIVHSVSRNRNVTLQSYSPISSEEKIGLQKRKPQ